MGSDCGELRLRLYFFYWHLNIFAQSFVTSLVSIKDLSDYE